MIDLVIKNAKMVFPKGIIDGGVAVKGEKIVMVADDANLPSATRVIDAKGNYLIPGVIDPHVHLAAASTPGYAPPGFPIPGLKEAEAQFEKDCLDNSIMCAITGTTTYGHFIHSGPKSKTNLEMFRRYKACAERALMTDIFFHAICSNDEQIEEIPAMAEEAGITSFKVMYNAYFGPDGMFAGLNGLSDAQMLEVLDKVADIVDAGYQGAWTMIHAENQDMVYKIRDFFKSSRSDMAVWNDSRPRLLEIEMMRRFINMAKAINLIRQAPPIYICHMTIAEDVDIVAETKAEGELKIASETGPQWLLLTKNNEELGTLAKVNPPLREQNDCDKLWVGLREGLIECVATDNIASMKLAAKPNDIWKAVSGFPGEAPLPLMLSEGVNKGRISLERLVEVMCANPAKVFGLYPQKGAILPGADADLVIVDLEKKQKATKEVLRNPAEFSVFDGWEFTGWPVTTIVRGQVIFEEGEVVGKAGTGKYWPRAKKGLA